MASAFGVNHMQHGGCGCAPKINFGRRRDSLTACPPVASPPPPAPSAEEQKANWARQARLALTLWVKELELHDQ